MRYAALMVIDAPAIVAILFDEPERARFAAAIDAAAPRLLSAVTFGRRRWSSKVAKVRPRSAWSTACRGW